MIVVADTSPLNYLIQIESEQLLPQLYQRVLVPLAVVRELRDPNAPQVVRRWASHMPTWLEVLQTSTAPYRDLAYLDPGEREAIQLAQEQSAELLLIDKRKGRLAAQRRGLMTTGTLGVLLRAGELGFADSVATYQRLVSRTSFRTSAALEIHFLEMVSRTRSHTPLAEQIVSSLGNRKRPNLIVHCDWGSTPEKRWMAKAVLENDRYTAYPPEKVDYHKTLLSFVKRERRDGIALVGFDFPIGLPAAYAKKAGASKFLAFLEGLVPESDFFKVCGESTEISIDRPFYPNAPGGRLQTDLADALGIVFPNLLRVCDQPQGRRPAAGALFWTLGGKQSGKAAIIGWRDVLAPAVREDTVKIWPFHGTLDSLLQTGTTVVCETYPTQYHQRLFAKQFQGKRFLSKRRELGRSWINRASELDINLAQPLKEAILAGFPNVVSPTIGGNSIDEKADNNDDPFDAVVGLFGMIDSLRRNEGVLEPVGSQIREIEGWILGLPRV